LGNPEKGKGKYLLYSYLSEVENALNLGFEEYK
jgi:hypothetical protein